MAWEFFRQTDFSGGENRNLRQVQPNQVLLAKNCIKRPDGSYVTRKGSARVPCYEGNFTGAAEVNFTDPLAMLRFQRDNGVESLMIHNATNMWVLNYDGTTAPYLKSLFTDTFTSKLATLFWDNRLFFSNSDYNLSSILIDQTTNEGSNPPGNLSAFWFNYFWNLATFDGKTNSLLYGGPVLNDVYDGVKYSAVGSGVDHLIQVSAYSSTAPFALIDYYNITTNYTTGWWGFIVFNNKVYMKRYTAVDTYVINEVILSGGNLTVDTANDYTLLHGTQNVEGASFSYDFGEEIIALESTADYLVAYSAANTYHVTFADDAFAVTPVGEIITPPAFDVIVPVDPTIKGDVLCVHAERLWVADADYPDVIACSDLGDPLNWNVLNRIAVGQGDGDYITAMLSLENCLVVCKRHSTWLLYGGSYLDWSLTKAPVGLSGAVNAQSIVGDGRQGIFIGHDNLYTVNSSGIAAVGDTHKQLILSMTENDKQASYAVALPYDNGRVVMSLGSKGTLNVETRLGGINTWDLLDAECGCGNNLKDDDGYLLTGGTDGYLYKWNGSTDAGAAITTKIIGGYTDCGTYQKKQFRRIDPRFGAEDITAAVTLTLSVDTDYQMANTIGDIDTSVLADSRDVTIAADNNNFLGATVGLELHTSRGVVMAPIFETTDRIIFSGYECKFRKVGSW